MDSLRQMAVECADEDALLTRIVIELSDLENCVKDNAAFAVQKARALLRAYVAKCCARAAAGALREAAEAHGDVCESCHRPKATDDDWERYGEGEGEHLCWGGCVFLGRTVAGWLRERAAALDARGDEK